jgi:hypothetical protein
VVNHHTLSDFRVEHGEALQDLFVQVLAMLTMKKLIALERVTVAARRCAPTSIRKPSRAGRRSASI